MKIFNKADFFAELNLENLPKNKKDLIWQKFLELVSLEVLDNILDELPSKEQEKLFLDLAKKPKNVVAFLQKNPSVRKFTPYAISKIKKEIFKSLNLK